MSAYTIHGVSVEYGGMKCGLYMYHGPVPFYAQFPFSKLVTKLNKMPKDKAIGMLEQMHDHAQHQLAQGTTPSSEVHPVLRIPKIREFSSVEGEIRNTEKMAAQLLQALRGE